MLVTKIIRDVAESQTFIARDANLRNGVLNKKYSRSAVIHAFIGDTEESSQLTGEGKGHE